MTVYLIRHTSVDVPKGTCYGWTDVRPAATFEAEAAETLRHLDGIMFDAVYSSPLMRARRLAEFCGYASPVIDSRLKEMNMGAWEMRRFDEIDDENLQRYYDDYINTPATGGESFRELYARVASFLDELRQSGRGCVAVFAHGGVLMCAGIYAGLYTTEECFSHITPYGGVMKISL